MKLTQVIFGGAMALYVDGNLEIFRRRDDYDDFISYLLNRVHEKFEPVKTIAISDYSTYWDSVTNFASDSWTPDIKLDDLMKKIDKTDEIY